MIASILVSKPYQLAARAMDIVAEETNCKGVWKDCAVSAEQIERIRARFQELLDLQLTAIHKGEQ